MANQYIITEEQIRGLLSNFSREERIGVANNVRSHPYNPQAKNCKVCSVDACSIKKFINQEREKVLDKVLTLSKDVSFMFDSDRRVFNKGIESLRQEGKVEK